MRNVVELAESLVAFDSVSKNSNLKIAEFLGKIFESMGFAVELHKKDYAGVIMANLIARIGPKDVEPLMLCGHMDTMPIGDIKKWCIKDPFKLTPIGGKLYGRGAVDMKGPIAALVCAVEPLIEKADKFKRELVFGLTHDEELGLKGAKRFVKERIVIPRFTIIAEPTNLIPGRMHKGYLCLTASCKGENAHSGNPGKGVNAIEVAAEVIAELMRFGKELQTAINPCINPPYATLNIAAISGGVPIQEAKTDDAIYKVGADEFEIEKGNYRVVRIEGAKIDDGNYRVVGVDDDANSKAAKTDGAKLNEIPDRCDVSFSIRIIPGQSISRVRKDIEFRLAKIRWDRKQGGSEGRGGPLVSVDLFEKEKGRRPTEPVCTSGDSEIIRIAEKVTGKTAMGECYSTDASVLQELGSDFLIFGPGNINVAHKANEFIEKSQLMESVGEFRKIVELMCLGEKT